MHPVPHVLRGLSEEIDGYLLLGGGVEGNNGKATVEVVFLWNTTEDNFRYVHDLCEREVRRETKR